MGLDLCEVDLDPGDGKGLDLWENSVEKTVFIFFTVCADGFGPPGDGPDPNPLRTCNSLLSITVASGNHQFLEPILRGHPSGKANDCPFLFQEKTALVPRTAGQPKS